MRVRVDRKKCTGHGRCYVLAPEVYQHDDEGCCVIPNEQVPTELISSDGRHVVMPDTGKSVEIKGSAKGQRELEAGAAAGW